MNIIVNRLKNLIPSADIAFIHSKMDKDEIEQTLGDFIENRYNVLVSTTIIETGIDIPNSNTLIIHDATRLGLSQLYQLRGRVGRSDRIAYAYIFYDHETLLTKVMKDRLEAISKFSALGSGYKIAKRDLAIRGAGDILGSEQSGFIDSIGLELYMKLVQDSIKGIDSDATLSKYTKNDGLNLHGHYIDASYISDDDVRLEVHRRIMAIEKVSDALNIKEELIDRFGMVDQTMESYIFEVLFKKSAYRLGKFDYFEERNTFSLVYYNNDQLDKEKLFQVIKRNQNLSSIMMEDQKIRITLYLNQISNHYFLEMAKLIEEYFNEN